MSRSTRAVPLIPGRELPLRERSAAIRMALILSANHSATREARRNTSLISHIASHSQHDSVATLQARSDGRLTEQFRGAAYRGGNGD